jgi:hypothetical protein
MFEAISEWGTVFVDDNEIIFDDEAWKKFVNLEPKISYNGEWIHVKGSKRFEGYNHNKKVKLNLNGWFKLKKMFNFISLARNIDEARNHGIYLNLMKAVGIDGKVRKYEKRLEKIRSEGFIKREANQLRFQLDRQEYPEKIQQQCLEWQLQTHRPPEGLKTAKRNIHIAYQKSKVSNLWPLRNPNKGSTLAQYQNN